MSLQRTCLVRDGADGDPRTLAGNVSYPVGPFILPTTLTTGHEYEIAIIQISSSGLGLSPNDTLSKAITIQAVGPPMPA